MSRIPPRASNVERLVDRMRRWRLPGVGRVLLTGVQNERYLARLMAAPDSTERASDG